jgi:GNAT superfamily N-acetyltransferase
MAAQTDIARLELSLTDSPDAKSEAAIDNGLARFNRDQAGYADARPLAVLIRELGAGEVVGGLLGRTSLGLFFIDLLFLPDEARGRGLGGRIMAMAEDEARRRGCSAATLYTITFQAPDFYARHGYRELGRIECAPPCHVRVCMAKLLVEPARIHGGTKGLGA